MAHNSRPCPSDGPASSPPSFFPPSCGAATKPAERVSRTWRSYLRFSVRGLILLVLAIGVGLGWMVQSARNQHDAVAAIEKAGGSVSYDWEWRNGTAIPAGKPWAPRWLVDLMGVDYFGHVTDVSLPGATDAAIVPVARLTQLQRLILAESSMSDVGVISFFDVNRPRVTSAGLMHLKKLTNLAELDLGGTQVSDAGLAHLKGLTKLSVLDIRGNEVTDAGLAHLKGLTNLSVLSVCGNPVTDAGLAHLAGLTNLSTLRLDGTRVTDAGLAHLKGLTKLRRLSLDGTEVTDAGLTNLMRLTKLSDLDLSFTEITDAGLTHLTALTKLSSVELDGTGVTETGRKALEEALPRLSLNR
jgi:internalin A